MAIEPAADRVRGGAQRDTVPGNLEWAERRHRCGRARTWRGQAVEGRRVARIGMCRAESLLRHHNPRQNGDRRGFGSRLLHMLNERHRRHHEGPHERYYPRPYCRIHSTSLCEALTAPEGSVEAGTTKKIEDMGKNWKTRL